MSDDGQSSFGITHLANHPITLTFGISLLAVLIILIVLRVVFGEIRVGVKSEVIQVGAFFTIQALIMFALGVVLSMWVKGLIGQAKTKVSGG